MNGEVLNSLPGETPGEKIVRMVNKYIGCSLINERTKLADLIARGVDDPNQVVEVKTNCGMFALAIMEIAGARHDILNKKYVIGMAIGWVRQIGIDLKALNKYTGKNGPQPKRGDLLHYFSPGANNNHVEWLLSDPNENGIAEHGGGGRPNNAITKGTSSILYSSGRPLQEFIDCTKLGIEYVPFGSDINEAIPDQTK
jgi:hypothetical protein